MIMWLKPCTNNLRIASSMGSNPDRDKALCKKFTLVGPRNGFKIVSVKVESFLHSQTKINSV